MAVSSPPSLVAAATAGTASALLEAMIFGIGCLADTVFSLVPNGTVYPFIGTTIACGTLAWMTHRCGAYDGQ